VLRAPVEDVEILSLERVQMDGEYKLTMLLEQ